MAPASKDTLLSMLKIVTSIMSRPESKVFHDPVDWKGLGLTDYPEIIKNPMDLGTIKTKIEAGSYNTTDETAADIRLVWYNCMLYNRDGSEVRLFCNFLLRAEINN